MRARVALLLAAVTGCRSTEAPPGGQPGAAIGRGLAAAMEAAATVKAPWRCAALDGATRPGGPAAATPATTVGDGERAWTREGATLRARRERLVIAAVAQARGDELPAALRTALAAAEPDLVLALGGMGGDAAELARALAGLAVPGALVVAMAGDAEPWPALSEAIDELAAGGVAIVDGAAVRTLDAGVAVVATLPGLARPGQLAAGSDGCVHDDEDVAAVLAALDEAAGERPRVLAGPRAPQGGEGPGGDHDVVDGVHAGDPGLAALVTPAGLTLAVHGLVGGAAGEGRAAAGKGAVVAAGSLDPAPRWDVDGRPVGRSVTLATIDARGVAWRSLTARGEE